MALLFYYSMINTYLCINSKQPSQHQAIKRIAHVALAYPLAQCNHNIRNGPLTHRL